LLNDDAVEQSYGESRKKAISKIAKPPKLGAGGPESRGSPAGDAKSAPKIGKPKHGGSAPEPEILPTPMFRVPGLEDDTQTFKTEYRDDSLPPNIFGVDNFFGMSREEFEETVQMMNEPIPGCVHVQHPMIADRRNWGLLLIRIYMGLRMLTRAFHCCVLTRTPSIRPPFHREGLAGALRLPCYPTAALSMHSQHIPSTNLANASATC
jgi:hypothetical protein